jgi:hypothetical protein
MTSTFLPNVKGFINENNEIKFSHINSWFFQNRQVKCFVLSYKAYPRQINWRSNSDSK